MSIAKIDSKESMKIIRQGINSAIVEAAEVEIQAALKKIEATMRAKVASIAVSMVQGEIDIFRSQNKLCITIRDQEKYDEQ